MDPAMEDSDLDGINDGQRPNNDGLNRSGLVKKYCPDLMIQQMLIVILTLKLQMTKIYDNLENYTNFEEMQNGQIQYPMTLTQISGTTVQKYSIRTMMTMEWQLDGNIISNSILMMQLIEW